MKAIILAAGKGNRMGSMTNNVPKTLINVNDETILGFQLRNLIDAGILDIFIVVGYHASAIKDFISSRGFSKIHLVYNKRYEETDNAYSLLLALNEIGNASVIVLDGDVLFDKRLLEKIVISEKKDVAVVDNDKIIEQEDAKVLVCDGKIKRIGKMVSGNMVYASIIKLSHRTVDLLKREIQNKKREKEWYSEPLDRLLQKGNVDLFTIQTNGLLRCEIDTVEDLYAARKMLKEMEMTNGEKI